MTRHPHHYYDCFLTFLSFILNIEQTSIVSCLRLQKAHFAFEWTLLQVDAVRVILKKELRIPVLEITDKSATLDGGDVLFTGREFFIGISRRTNESGAKAVADAFPEFPVTPIPIPGKILHLKSCMSMAGPGIIAVSQSPECQEIVKKMERESTFKYSIIKVTEDAGANVLYVNGTLIHRSEFPSCVQIFEEKIDYPKIPIKIWELSKPQASLTCLSLLIRKSKIL